MDFLNLTEWITVHRDISDGSFVVVAKCSSTRVDCPNCGRKDALRKHGRKAVTYLDTPFDGRPLRIEADVQRYRCRNCLATTLQSLPEVDENRRITNRGIQYICDQSWFTSTGALARHLGCAEKTVRNIQADYLNPVFTGGFSRYRPELVAALEKFMQRRDAGRRKRSLIDENGLLRCSSCLGWFERAEMENRQNLKCRACELRSKSLMKTESSS